MTAISKMILALWVILVVTADLACESSVGEDYEDGTGGDTDSDIDGDSDNDTDVDSDSDTDTDTDADTDTDSDTDTDTDTDSDTDSDTDTDSEYTDQDSDGWVSTIDCDDENPNANQGEEEIYDPPNGVDEDCDGLTDEGEEDIGPTGNLKGRVWSPSQTIPVSGALVYLTSSMPDPIPDQVFAYEGDDMTGLTYTLSDPDGTWAISNAPVGDWYLVTRKGNFRRIREVTVEEDVGLTVPHDDTTLPPDDTPDGMDTIPNFALLLTYPDLVLNLLAKFGMGDVDGSGDLIYGSETFDLYTNRTVVSGYSSTTDLFANQDSVDQYHMLFFPCMADSTGLSYVTSQFSKLQTFVTAGGKLYNSCTCAVWTEGAFPEYIEYYGDDSPDQFDIGRITSFDYSTTGEVLDQGLADWLEVVTTESVTAFPFDYGYVKIDATVDVDDGNGLEADDYWVKPYTWVKDNQAYPGSPLMVTYNYQSGKVFYTVYETSGTNTAITPQEYALLYVILEVGVSENPPPPPT